MLIIHDYTVIAHAAYAKREEVVSFEDIIELSKIIYEKLDKNQMYFMYKTTGANSFKIHEKRFVRGKNEIKVQGTINEDFLNGVTMCYPEKVQELIMEARKEYTKRNCKVLNLNNPDIKKKVS